VAGEDAGRRRESKKGFCGGVERTSGSAREIGAGGSNVGPE
jgi:hypothetical protein